MPDRSAAGRARLYRTGDLVRDAAPTAASSSWAARTTRSSCAATASSWARSRRCSPATPTSPRPWSPSARSPRPAGARRLRRRHAGPRGGRRRPAAPRREHLPAYMVPAAVVSCDALPLTPNGKVDRDALPEPGPGAFGGRTGEAVAPRTALEAKLLSVWQEVLRSDEIGVSDDFFDLGVDSLTAARLFTRMERDLQRRLPRPPCSRRRRSSASPRPLEQDRGDSRRWSSLVPLRTGGSPPVIACVHGGAGTVLFYNDLGPQPRRQPAGVRVSGRGPLRRGARADQRAADGSHVRRRAPAAVPTGPYVLAGYCYGGMVAYEMAQQLRARGADVRLLVMLNAPSPTYNATYQPIFDESGLVTHPARRPVPNRDTSLRGSVTRHWSTSAGGPLGQGRSVAAAASRRARATARAWLRPMRFAAATRLRRPLPDDLRESRQFQKIAARAQRLYSPAPYEGAMVVFRSHGLYHEDDLGWRAYVRGPIACYEVPGTHRTPRDAMRDRPSPSSRSGWRASRHAERPGEAAAGRRCADQRDRAGTPCCGRGRARRGAPHVRRARGVGQSPRAPPAGARRRP